MKKIYPSFLFLIVSAGASCSLLETDGYGYNWMEFNNISFGLGELDSNNAKVEGVACRVDGNQTMYADLEFRYKFFHDANGDRQCQAAEVLAEDAHKFEPGEQEIHIENVSLRGGAEDVSVFLGIYDGGNTLASYQGGLQF